MFCDSLSETDSSTSCGSIFSSFSRWSLPAFAYGFVNPNRVRNIAFRPRNSGSMTADCEPNDADWLRRAITKMFYYPQSHLAQTLTLRRNHCDKTVGSQLVDLARGIVEFSSLSAKVKWPLAWQFPFILFKYSCAISRFFRYIGTSTWTLYDLWLTSFEPRLDVISHNPAEPLDIFRCDATQSPAQPVGGGLGN